MTSRRSTLSLCPFVVARDAKTQRVHHTDQFFGLGIARARGGPQRLVGRLVLSGLHQIARHFQFGQSRGGQKTNGGNVFKTRRDLYFLY